VRQRIEPLLFVALVALISTACGGPHPQRLGEGLWYGKFIAIDAPQRTTTFTPACRFSHGRWVATRRDSTATAISPHADLEIYFRPGGRAAGGHAQSADVKLLSDVALHGRAPDSPPGWFVRVRDHVAVAIWEDSGVHSSGRADQRTFACLWSRSTSAFVDN
jgi:hypothetical protein